MEVDRALEHVLDGDAILFVGAGFSLGATNLRGEPFKDAKQLAASLGQRAGLGPDFPLDLVTEQFIAMFGEDELIAELQKEYTAQTVAPYHLIYADLQWRRLYTTNYDNILETAAIRQGRRINPVTPAADIRSLPKEVIVQGVGRSDGAVCP
jgi:hypothetical protein